MKLKELIFMCLAGGCSHNGRLTTCKHSKPITGYPYRAPYTPRVCCERNINTQAEHCDCRHSKEIGDMTITHERINSEYKIKRNERARKSMVNKLKKIYACTK